VFAIVITLLVLELKIPHVEKDAHLVDQLHGLASLTPQFVSIAVSFLMIAVFWVNHHQFLRTLAQADRAMLWYNNLFLFWLALIPFPSAYLGEYPNHILPVMLFGFIMLAAAVSFALMRRYAHLVAGLAHEEMSPAAIRGQFRRSLIGPVMYGAAIPLALVSVYLSVLIYLAVPIVYFLPQGARKAS
jgi:uncharacterized membrane protein